MKKLYLTLFIAICSMQIVFAQNLPVPKLVKTFSRQRGNALSVSYKGLYYFNYFGELWSSDGTSSGTTLVKTINSKDTSGGSISALRIIDNQIYIVADDGIHGRELWTSDGTSQGTQMIIDLNPNGDGFLNRYSDYSFVELNGYIFFYGNDGINGMQLWKSDGTNTGTQMVKKINASGSIVSPNGYMANSEIVSTGKKIFFSADDGTGLEPWVSDGTGLNTHMIVDLAPKGSSGADNFIPYNDMALFIAFDTADIFSLDIYATDAAAQGTYPILKKKVFASLDYKIFNGKLYFFTNQNAPVDFWETDGTIFGTKKIKRCAQYSVPTSLESYKCTQLTLYNNAMYFCGAEDSLIGNAICNIGISDGTELGTTFKDINSTLQSSNPLHFTNFGGLLYFMARDTNSVFNICRTDGYMVEKIPYTYVDNKINAITHKVYLCQLPLTPVGTQLFYWDRYNVSEGFALYKLDMFPDAITDVNKQTSATLYPNPATTVLTVQADNAVRVDIYSVTGSLVNSVAITSGKQDIELSQLSPAVYTATISFQDGSRQNLKFVKQ